MNKRRVGSEKEEMAAKYLTQAGMQILMRNFRCRQGEIDLVAQDGDVIVFVEVKYRRTSGQGLPEESVSLRKMQKISRVAEFFYARYQLLPDTPCRFYVIAFEGNALRYYRNAFPFAAY